MEWERKNIEEIFSQEREMHNNHDSQLLLLQNRCKSLVSEKKELFFHILSSVSDYKHIKLITDNILGIITFQLNNKLLCQICTVYF